MYFIQISCSGPQQNEMVWIQHILCMHTAHCTHDTCVRFFVTFQFNLDVSIFHTIVVEDSLDISLNVIMNIRASHSSE